MDAVEELDDPKVSIVSACAALGVSRATVYRNTQAPTPPSWHERPPNPRRLDDVERAAVLDVLHSAEFVASLVMSQVQTWLGAVAVNEGFVYTCGRR